jgi:hypothetical protein
MAYQCTLIQSTKNQIMALKIEISSQAYLLLLCVFFVFFKNDEELGWHLLTDCALSTGDVLGKDAFGHISACSGLPHVGTEAHPSFSAVGRETWSDANGTTGQQKVAVAVPRRAGWSRVLPVHHLSVFELC